ncbi:energy transducer TonB [Nitrospirillum amazonense]|nr:energy transducer TonB [Nitrospirillum amazonense]
MRFHHLIFPLPLLTVACASTSQPALDPKTPPKLDAASFARFPPQYPMAAIRLKEEGVVAIAVLCETDGHVTDGQVAVSSGHPQLDMAVEHAARSTRWRCKPALNLATQQPFAAWDVIRYRFQLKADEGSSAATSDLASGPYAHVGAVLDPQSFKPLPYPRDAEAAQERAPASIRFLCGVDGRVHTIEPLTSPDATPHLTRALIAAAKADNWRCLPATDYKSKEPVEGWGFYRYDFGQHKTQAVPMPPEAIKALGEPRPLMHAGDAIPLNIQFTGHTEPTKATDQDSPSPQDAPRP